MSDKNYHQGIGDVQIETWGTEPEPQRAYVELFDGRSGELLYSLYVDDIGAWRDESGRYVIPSEYYSVNGLNVVVNYEKPPMALSYDDWQAAATAWGTAEGND